MTGPKVVDPRIARADRVDRPLVDVAVGVLVRKSDGAFLLTSRPLGRPYAGYWEFPGGKLEAGETVLEALGRELKEEIGIQVLEASVWQEESFDYPQAVVRLHFGRVTNWSGDIEMLEGQEFNWAQLPVTVRPILPGTIPVLEWFVRERDFTGAIAINEIVKG